MKTLRIELHCMQIDTVVIIPRKKFTITPLGNKRDAEERRFQLRLPGGTPTKVTPYNAKEKRYY